MSCQIRLDVSGVQREEYDTIFIAQLPLQGVYKLDGGKLALTIQLPSVLFLSCVGVSDPVVLDRWSEEILNRGRNPGDPAGILRGSR